MKLEISKELDFLKDKIEKAYQEIMPVIEGKIELPDIDIVVSDNPKGVIPEIGIGGNSPDANSIFINIDKDFPNIENEIEEKIKSTLAHESHHCTRSEYFYYGDNLLEAMVTEGLADHFDLEINDGEEKPWCDALSDEELIELMKKAEKEFNNEKYDHVKWFFGVDSEIPKWAGYSIGFKIVGDYLEKTGKKASELFSLDSKEFLNY